MQIKVNNEPREVSAETTVADLLIELGVDTETVVVQRNDDIVQRDRFGIARLQDGDEVQLVRFVGGG